MQTAVHVGFEVGRLDQAFARLILRHVVVADFDGQCADAPTFFAHFGEQVVRHVPQSGVDIFLVRQVGGKSFLLAERLLRLARRNQRALVNPVGELPDSRGLAAEQ